MSGNVRHHFASRKDHIEELRNGSLKVCLMLFSLSSSIRTKESVRLRLQAQRCYKAGNSCSLRVLFLGPILLWFADIEQHSPSGSWIPQSPFSRKID